MRQILMVLILMVSLTTFGQEFEFDHNKDFEKILSETIDTSSTLHFDKLLKRFQYNDITLTDFQVLALLIGFTRNEHFKPYNYLTSEREIYALNDKGKYQEAIAKCDSFLVYVPISQQALIEKSYSFYKLAKADSAQYYMWKFRKIMDAMGQSGDGLTPETAIFSLGPTDGQNFIEKYLSSGIGTMGSGRDKHGNFVDIIEATQEDGEQEGINLYFQIEHANKTILGNLNLEDIDKKRRKNK